MSIDFLAQLPIWPADPADQINWFNRLKVLLNNQNAEIEAGVVDVVTLSQSAEPSQSDWETAYTTQTGKSLPIPATARLQWWDSTNSRFAGMYGTLLNSSTVYPRSGLTSPGATSVFSSDVETAGHTVDYVIGESLVNHPSLTITVAVPTKFQLMYSLLTTLSAGSGSWGGDFLINGVKAGSLYYALAANRGLVERTTTGQIIASLTTPTLNPDTYVIQAILGRTNATTPTVTVAARHLFVRGISQ